MPVGLLASEVAGCDRRQAQEGFPVRGGRCPSRSFVGRLYRGSTTVVPKIARHCWPKMEAVHESSQTYQKQKYQTRECSETTGFGIRIADRAGGRGRGLCPRGYFGCATPCAAYRNEPGHGDPGQRATASDRPMVL